ncbi:MAG: hypothetical protein U0163_03895 [Gemmatimonadaceae bacterium]
MHRARFGAHRGSGLLIDTHIDRYAACDDGYLIYTIDPAVTPPNLAAVQEMAVGIVRVDSLHGTDPLPPTDSAEVWVDDIRLGSVVNATGYAAEIGATVDAGDFGSLRMRLTRRDPNFHQLGEQPTYQNANDLEFGGTIQLERFLARDIGVSIPLTVQHTADAATPQFLTSSDIRGESVSDLRTPRTSLTTMTLGVRRRAPLDGPWYAPIVNNVALNAIWNRNGNQSEFQKGRVRNFNVGVEYLGVGEVPEARSGLAQLVGALFGGAAGGGTAWRPTAMHLTSNLERASDRRESFLKPAAAFDDSARVVDGDNYLWRTGSNIEFRPVGGVVARWDALTLRDLRSYGPAADGVAAPLSGSQFAGLDVGFERERRMTAALTYAPVPTGWLRPRLELGSSYTMLRDPNTRAYSPFASGDSGSLPRRFGNSQRVAASAIVDLQGYAKGMEQTHPSLARLARAIRPIDVSVSRDLLTAFDGVPVGPSLGYQFGIGGIDGFRSIQGLFAASAGQATVVTVGDALQLPWGAALSGRVQRGTSRHWARQVDERQLAVDGTQTTLPDATLRWSGRPRLLSGMFSSLSTSARYLSTRQAFAAPSAVSGAPEELRATHIRSWPLSATAVTTWGDLSLTGAVARSERVDSLPGSVGTSSSSDLTTDVARSFPLPTSWSFKSRLRARMSYQRTEAQSYVSNVAAATSRSRLTDNGRTAFSLSAGTDVTDNATFSLQGSRVVTFDRNFNRRFTQVIVSTVVQIQFFGGASR